MNRPAHIAEIDDDDLFVGRCGGANGNRGHECARLFPRDTASCRGGATLSSRFPGKSTEMRGFRSSGQFRLGITRQDFVAIAKL